jgi:uncharacterized protein (TIGR03435 family)
MKRDEQNIKEIFDRSFPSPTQAEVESTCDRVLNRLMDGGADGLQETIVDPVQPVRSRWQITPIGIAAAIAVLAVFSIPFLRTVVLNRSIYAIVENEDGSQYRLAAGKVVRTEVWAGLMLTLADGSNVEMRSQSELSLERADDGMRIRLSKGAIIVNAARQHSGHLYVHTKDATVSVIGTVFFVGVEEAGSRVAVIEGQVHVQHAAVSKTLMAGQQMATSPLMELHPLAEEISWSRHVAEHLTLLQLGVEPIPAKEIEKPVEIVQAQTSALAVQQNQTTPKAPRPQFEVASLKRNSSGSPAINLGGSPGRYSATNASLRLLMQIAYKVEDFQIVGAPGWIDSERYDIEAKAEGTPSRQEIIGPMLQALIEERFKLAMHGETRDLPVYFLTVAKSGSKLKSEPCLTREPNQPIPPGTRQSAYCGYGGIGDGTLRATGAPIEVLANFLSNILKRKVLDKTGLSGDFDVNLKWAPDLSTPGNNPSTTADAGPSIFTAIEEQLGLKLESGKAPIDVLVIDYVQRPSEN